MLTSRILMTAALVVGVVSAAPESGNAKSGSSAAVAPARAVVVAVHRIRTTSIPRAGSSAPTRPQPPGRGLANLHIAPHPLPGGPGSSAPRAAIRPSSILGVVSRESGWQGLDHFDQRMADNGDQGEVIPPDQGLCSNGRDVVEAVNNAIRVYSTSGTPTSGIVSSNQFFWGDHWVVHSASGFTASPHELVDPSCIYDAGSHRFYLTMFELVSDHQATPLGPSALDIAVSSGPAALGTWTVYRLNTTNDGTNGTPLRRGCPCFPDYPHIGTDANGLYVSVNEFSTRGTAANGAVVYAINKAALALGTPTIRAAMLNTSGQDVYNGTRVTGFTLAPALSTGTQYAPNTMYFLSSTALTALGRPIWSRRVIAVWQIGNTRLLRSRPASLVLTRRGVAVGGYFLPPGSNQKVGPVPLANCLNDTTCATFLLGSPDKFRESEYALESNDTRMMQSAYAHGRLWGAVDTAVIVGGTRKAGVTYFVIAPTTGRLIKQVTLAVGNANITYPALGVTATGHAVMALTLSGRDYFPSAAYVRVDDRPATSAGLLTVVGAGQGPADEFGGYRAFPSGRPRWGDYGAAVVVGPTVWIASEFIAQTCTLAQYEADPFGTCNNTRTAFANWSTHVTSVLAG
jgi:hypothetical protein